MKMLKRISSILVLLLALWMLAGLTPVTVLADTHIDTVEITMGDLSSYFSPQYTEGTVYDLVIDAVSVPAGSPYFLSTPLTGLIKIISGNAFGVRQGNGHMNPSIEYLYRFSVSP